MTTKNFYTLFSVRILTLLCAPLLFSMSVHTSSQNTTQNNNNDETEQDVDVWFGPGFYYGIWFDNEDDYWQWRGNHRDYPSNRNYYHHDHPIDYDHERPNERGGGGARGGGGHGGGGRR